MRLLLITVPQTTQEKKIEPSSYHTPILGAVDLGVLSWWTLLYESRAD